jgi:hypothetical protein
MSSASVRFAGVALLAAAAFAAPRALAAQDTTASKNHLYDKFQATLDFSTVLNNSEARVDGSGGEGTNLNFKDLLGISGSSIQPALGLAWKPGRHTELSIGYQFINQSGSRSWDDSLVIGDNTVSGQIDADTKIGSDNANLAFKYAILAKEKYIAGVEIGLGAIFFDMQLDATADVCSGPDCGTGSVSIDRKLTVPTGALGVFGQWRLGDSWYVGGDARGIGGKVDRYDVSIFQADVFARYYFSDRWGAGAGWYYNDVTVNVDPKEGASPGDGDLDLGGKVSFNYTSLRLGVIAAF